MAGKFPRAYVNDVPAEGAERVMEYVPFDRLDIGARNSGMPKGMSGKQKLGLDHVGSTAGGSK